MSFILSACAILGGVSFSRPVKNKSGTNSYSVSKIYDAADEHSEKGTIIIPSKTTSTFKVQGDSNIAFGIKINNEIRRMYAMGIVIPFVPTYSFKEKGFFVEKYCADIKHDYLDSTKVAVKKSNSYNKFLYRPLEKDSFFVNENGDTMMVLYEVKVKSWVEMGNCNDMVIDVSVFMAKPDSFYLDAFNIGLKSSGADTFNPWSVQFIRYNNQKSFLKNKEGEWFFPEFHSEKNGNYAKFRCHYTLFYPGPYLFTLNIPSLITKTTYSKPLHIICERKNHLYYFLTFVID